MISNKKEFKFKAWKFFSIVNPTTIIGMGLALIPPFLFIIINAILMTGKYWYQISLKLFTNF